MMVLVKWVVSSPVGWLRPCGLLGVGVRWMFVAGAGAGTGADVAAAGDYVRLVHDQCPCRRW